MVELIAVIGATIAFAELVRRRGGNLVAWVMTLVVLVFFSFAFGLVGILVRWAAIAACFGLVVLMTRRAAGPHNSWKCPACTAWNDAGSYYCLCGFENPEARSG